MQVSRDIHKEMKRSQEEEPFSIILLVSMHFLQIKYVCKFTTAQGERENFETQKNKYKCWITLGSEMFAQGGLFME